MCWQVVERGEGKGGLTVEAHIGSISISIRNNFTAVQHGILKIHGTIAIVDALLTHT